MYKLLWIFLVGLATLVTCSGAGLTTVSDPRKVTVGDNFVAAKRLLRRESIAATKRPTIVKKDSQKLLNSVSEERSVAAKIGIKIFRAIEKVVGPKIANKLEAKIVSLTYKLCYTFGYKPDYFREEALRQTNLATKKEYELIASDYAFYYWKKEMQKV